MRVLLFLFSLIFFYSNMSLSAVPSSLPDGLDIDPDNLDPDQFIPKEFKNKLDKAAAPIIQATGFAFQQRSYEPATRIGTDLGIHLGADVTIVGMDPDTLNEFMELSGGGGSPAGGKAFNLLPVARVHIHKGLAKIFDFGLSYLYYDANFLFGADLKTVFSEPKEGLHWAIRGSYSTAFVEIVETTTYSLQLLASKKFSIFDPYIGVGSVWTSGTVIIPYALPVPFDDKIIEIESSSSFSAIQAFVGIQMVFWPTGISWTIEGSYHSKSANTLGMKLGLKF